METRAHYILIGLFTVTAIAAVLGFVLWLSATGTDRDVQRYDILFREPVAGLNAGSAVQYSGIRVGEVERLTLDPEDPRMVWVRVRVSAATPIKVDTQARLALVNITGAYSIELSQGLPESPQLTSATGIPVIEASPSPFTQLRLSGEELLVSINTLLDNANAILSGQNAEHLGRVLANLDSITTAIDEQQDTMAEGLRTVLDAGERLIDLMANIETQAERHVEPLFQSASGVMLQIETMTAQVDTILRENSEALSSGLQSVAELGPAMRELREILATLNQISNRIEEDPADFLFGGANIRDYRP